MSEFYTAIDGMIIKRINSMHTAIPAIVREFDASNGVGNVIPLTRSVLSDGTVIEYPELFKVPFLFPRSAGAEIAFPVKEGDTCLLIFCENALDRWKGRGTLDSQMKFALSNAIAIPGLFSTPSELVQESQNDNAVIVSSGSKKVKITPNGIQMEGNVTINGNMTVNGDINSSSLTTQVITTGSCNLHSQL